MTISCQERIERVQHLDGLGHEDSTYGSLICGLGFVFAKVPTPLHISSIWLFLLFSLIVPPHGKLGILWALH